MIVAYGLLIPFLGTALGAACVFFLKDSLSEKLQKLLLGFASGVMVAASVWSLLIPAIEESSRNGMGRLAFIPAAVGIALGMGFLFLLDVIIPHQHMDSEKPEGPKSKLNKSKIGRAHV